MMMMMNQQHNDGSSPMMMMDPPYQKSQQPQQQHQPQQQYSVSLQHQPTTSAHEEEEEEEACRTLWIGNLENWMDEAYIDFCFARTREVFTSKIIRNKKTSSETCYGFIVFKSEAIAQRILHRFNGTPMPGATSNFSLNWADKVVVTDDGTTTTTTTTTTGQCEANCMFCSTTILPSIGPLGPELADVVCFDESSLTVCTVEKASWEYMLKWWSLSQFEGTCTADTVRATQRVFRIASFLFVTPLNYSVPTPGEAEKLKEMLDELQELLDELQSHVNSIDVAKQLHSMGALEALLIHVSCEHAGVGEKAAKIVRTMVENNSRSQQHVMEAGGGILLMDALACPLDATTETHVLKAISSLFQNNHFTAFRQERVYEGLYSALCTASVDWQRKALKLIHCLVLEHKSDCNIVTTGLGYHHFMIDLASSYCESVRVAALKCLLLLTQIEGDGNSDQLVKTDDQLKQVLEKRIKEISAMAKEDLAAAWEEKKLVASLWNACYNKTCPLDHLPVTYEEAAAAALALGPSAATWVCQPVPKRVQSAFWVKG